VYDWDSFLDYGCADGFLTRMIGEAFPEKEIYGYDADPAMIVKAQLLSDYGTPGFPGIHKNVHFSHNIKRLCESINTVFTGKTNKAGAQKTKQERLQVLVYMGADGRFKWTKKKKGVDFPANQEGERRGLNFSNITDPQKLANAGTAELAKYYYNGFRGKFTTFAIPNIKLGDYIALEDRVLPDRNGFYVVKAVERSGGVGGGRQVIELAYALIKKDGKLELPSFTPDQVL
jgi:hypothetical protein